LCFSAFVDDFFVSGSRRVGGGDPIISRAISFTAVTALNLFFLFRAMVDPSSCELPRYRQYELESATGVVFPMLDERDFFDERADKRMANLNCPHCHQSADYELAWLVRTKKRQLPPRADERDRARFAKARSYMVRRDDLVACKNLRFPKRFEVSGVQSVAFLD